LHIFDEKYISEWIASIGSVVGGILGGLFTIVALWLTLRYYRKKDRQDNVEKEESKRLSVIPYLTGKDYSVMGHEETYDVYFHSLENGMMNTFSCYVMIKNVGLSTAIGVTFPRLYPMENNNVENDNITLPVGESVIINLIADFRTDSGIGNVIWLTILFSDLLGNKYQQVLSLDISYERKYFKAGGTFHPNLLKE
jgi:hypothetical protein